MSIKKKLELSAQEAIQKLIVNHPTAMLFIRPDDGGIIDANIAAALYYGWSVEQLRKMNISEINTLPVESVQSEMALARSQQRNYFSFQHRLADGRVRDVEVHSVPYHWDRENVLCSMITDVTERKQMEQTLKESEDKYRHLFEMESDALLLIDAQTGDILDANVSAVNLYGYSRDDLLTMRNVDLSAEPEETRKACLNAVAGEIVAIPVRYHRKKNGAVFPVEINTTLLNWRSRHVFIPAIRDISERMQAEETLRENRERLSEVLENSLDAAYKRNLHTNSYDYMSPAFARITGYSPEEMKSLPIDRVLDLMHPDDLAEIERVIVKSMSGEVGRPYYMEYRFRHKDGNFVWLRDKFSVVWDEHGHPLARIGSVSDVTDSKKLADELCESEKRQRQMIANISDVIAIMSKEGIILYKSPNIEKWFGWQPEDLIGTNGWDTVHPDDLTRIQKEFHNLLNHDNATKTVEYRYKCKDGGYKNIELTATNLSNDPTINGVLLNYRDITEKLRNERLVKIAQERRHQSDLLNELVRESLPSEKVLREVSRMMGNKMFEPVSCFMIVLDEYRELSRDVVQERTDQYQILVESIIGSLEDSDRLVWESPDGIGVIYSGLNISEDIIAEQKKIADQLHQSLSRLMPDVKVSIGIAEISSSMTGFGLQYRQAVLAVNSGFKVWSQLKTYHYLDIGVFQVLSSFNEQNLINAFIERTLGKLLHYDNKKKVEFLSTLEALLLSENLKESADKLSVHYQTLLFRKNRLEKILGVSFDDSSVRMSILTALYLQKLQEK